MSTFKSFLRHFTKKYRMWADGMTEEDTQSDESSTSKEYMETMQQMLTLGATALNLDARNLKAYPATLKLWHQLQAYPAEIIPIMDQTLKDMMVELAEQDMARQRGSQSASQSTNGARSGPVMPSSDPIIPLSERIQQHRSFRSRH